VYRWLRRKEDSRLREVFHRLVAFLGASRGLPEGAPEGEGGVTLPDAP
jgi:hypothetical protein